jgi:nitrite reductase (NADH) small subunit
MSFRESFMAAFRTVCLVEDVPEGESRMLNVDGQMVGLFNVDGDFLAVSNECPHAGASLAHGTVDGEVVSCRIHHWRFCLRTGTYLDEDKPEFNARSFETRIVDGEVQVSVDAVESS